MATNLADLELRQLPHGLPDREFAEYLAEHLDNATLWTELLSTSAGADRAVRALGALIEHIQLMQGAKLADWDEYNALCPNHGGDRPMAEWKRRKAAYSRWKSNTGRFRHLVSGRLREAKEAVRHYGAERNRSNHRGATEAARRLAVGIRNHHNALFDTMLDPEPHDRALWALLNEVSIRFDDEDVVLSDLFDRGVWEANS